MKRLFAAALLALASTAFAATTLPPGAINPAGSTAGQVILSTGPSTAPAWGGVALSGVTGTLAIANGGTGATSAATARTNLGAASTGANTFTGAQVIQTSGLNNSLQVTDTGSNGANIKLVGNGATTPNKTIRVNGGGLQIINSAYSAVIFSMDDNGGTTFNVRPVFGSATPWDSANLNLAAPPCIGCTTPAAGAFTTLSATGLITPTSTIGIKGTTTNDSPAAGSIGENPTNSNSSVSMTNNTPANCTSQSLTAGNWLVWGVVSFVPNSGTTITQLVAGIGTTSATLPAIGAFSSLAATFTTSANQGLVTPPVTLKLASTTTVYLIGQSQFATSTMGCTGNISALRIR